MSLNVLETDDRIRQRCSSPGRQGARTSSAYHDPDVALLREHADGHWECDRLRWLRGRMSVLSEREAKKSEARRGMEHQFLTESMNHDWPLFRRCKEPKGVDRRVLTASVALLFLSGLAAVLGSP